jgi:hypothetical protein
VAVNYHLTLKNTRMTAVITALDTPSGSAKLVIWDASYVHALVTITLNKPSFANASAILTMQGTPLSGVAGATFTAALAQILDGTQSITTGGPNYWIQGLTVGTSATDIILNSTSITSGQTVTITSATITAAA